MTTMRGFFNGVRAAALWLAAGVSSAQETTVPQALETARKDLTAALAELEKARGGIAAERPELAREFEAVELELREKRRLARIARMSRADREQTLRDLERDRLLRSQDAGYLAGLLKDHALKVETLKGPGEPGLELDDAAIAAETQDDPAAALEARLGVVDASLARVEDLLGGSRSTGRAALPDGEVVEGEFVAAGPLAWFAGEAAAGAVVWERGAALPKVIPEAAEDVRALAGGEVREMGLDVTGGKARAMEEVEGGVVDLFRKGGLWIWPIIGLALLSLAFGIVKLVGFARFREPGEAWVNAIVASLRAGDRDKALALAGEPSHPVAAVMRKLVELSKSTADVVEETLYEQLMGVQQKAGALLPVIAVTAATAPLLGLLGTVSGMIRTFNLITLFGSGDPKPLAGGISEALITTLFGLIVAIPALILHAFLSRRSQGIVQTTERLGLSFVNSMRKG